MRNNKRPEHSKRMMGKGNPRYIDGRSLKRSCCQDCGILLAKGSFFGNSKRCYSCNNKGENNPAWKGHTVGYSGGHRWAKKFKIKPKLCERCGLLPPFDLSNTSGKYKQDINDWEWLCRGCHLKKDYTEERIKKIKEHVKLKKRDRSGRFIKWKKE